MGWKPKVKVAIKNDREEIARHILYGKHFCSVRINVDEIVILGIGIVEDYLCGAIRSEILNCVNVSVGKFFFRYVL